MASISSTSGSPALLYGWEQVQLQQAKRVADQAELNADTLQVQSQQARRVADQAIEQARALTVQSDQAQIDAQKARQGLLQIQSVNQAQTQVVKVVDLVTLRQQGNDTPSLAILPSVAAPVVNTQGQLTGTVVNTKA